MRNLEFGVIDKARGIESLAFRIKGYEGAHDIFASVIYVFEVLAFLTDLIEFQGYVPVCRGIRLVSQNSYH